MVVFLVSVKYTIFGFCVLRVFGGFGFSVRFREWVEGCEGVFERGSSVTVVIFARGSFWL